jgi:hypothetical protein
METIEQVRQYITDNIVGEPGNRLEVQEIQTAFLKILDQIGSQNFENTIAEWDAGTTYDTPATSETSLNPAYADYLDRIWKSKIDSNTGNQPPSQPGTTEDSNWIEVSAAATGLLQDWKVGLFGEGLVLVYYSSANVSAGFFELQEQTRPFESTDFEAELTAGSWKQVGLGPDSSEQITRRDGASSYVIEDVKRVENSLSPAYLIDYDALGISDTDTVIGAEITITGVRTDGSTGQFFGRITCGVKRITSSSIQVNQQGIRFTHESLAGSPECDVDIGNNGMILNVQNNTVSCDWTVHYRLFVTTAT